MASLTFSTADCTGIRSVSALPETWLGLLLQRAEDDPEVDLIQVAKEEEAVGIAAGAYFAGVPHILLMQNHGFLAAINGIVSLAQLYHIPLCMLIAYRGHWGEPYPWHTRGGIVTEEVLRALVACRPAIRKIAAGETVFDPQVEQQSTLKGERNRGLTQRELEVLQMIVDGKSNKEIATLLDLSANTVAVHRANIMNTLGIHKTAELVVYAIRAGLVNIP